jgi:hypothetical protein
MPLRGNDAVCYVDVNDDWDSPDWQECDLIEEFTLSAGAESAEIKPRSTKVNYSLKVRKNASATGNMLKQPGNEVYDKFADATTDIDGLLHLLILSGPMDVVGSRGVRGWFQNHGGDDDQGPSNVQYLALDLKPYPHAEADQVLQEAVVEAGPTVTYTDA